MANQLKMADIQAILALHRLGWPNRRIALELQIHRETVGQYVREVESKPASAPTVFSAELGPIIHANPLAVDVGVGAAPTGCGMVANDTADSKPASAPTGNFTEEACQKIDGEGSAAWPWRQVIIRKLDEGLSVQRILLDLQHPDHGYTGSYYSIRRLAQKLMGASPLPMRRMECEAGHEAQVDFGRGAPTRCPSRWSRTSFGKLPNRCCPHVANEASVVILH